MTLEIHCVSAMHMIVDCCSDLCVVSDGLDFNVMLC